MKIWFRGIALIPVAVLASIANADDWKQQGFDAARSRVTTEIVNGPFSPAWEGSFSTGIFSTPVTADGRVIVVDRAGTAKCFRETDGTVLWTQSMGEPVEATPAVELGIVYVPGHQGAFRALSLADHAEVWTIATDGTDIGSPQVSGNVVYSSSGFPNRKVVALNRSTGGVVWSSVLNELTYSSPALAASKVFIGTNRGSLFALDASTGDASWQYDAGGIVMLSSPFVDGDSVYLLPGGSNSNFYRVDVDSTRWAADNWSVALSDPAPPATTNLIGTNMAVSSPVLAGGRVVFLARFEYADDTNWDFYADTRFLREFVFAIDPSGESVAWQVLRGTTTVLSINDVPQLNVCPSPAAIASGVLCASSVDATLKVLSFTDGSDVASVALDDPCVASPIAANGRVLAATLSGKVHVFLGANAPPAEVSGHVPATGGDLDVAPADLSWSASEAGSTYLVRLDDDGEILMDWDFEASTTELSVGAPAVSEGDASYVWGVRPKDTAGAYGPWGAATFSVNLKPSPPASLVATSGHQEVILTWTASPSGNVTGYRLTYGIDGGGATTTVDFGLVYTTTVTGLTNGTDYRFSLRAIDAEDDLSNATEVVEAPTSLIMIGAQGYDTLQAASLVATSGQTIMLGEGTVPFGAAVVTLASGVNLQGVNAHVTRVRLVSGDTPGKIVASGINTISGIQFYDGDIGIQVTGGETSIIKNCILRDMGNAGIQVDGSASVINNTIVENGSVGIRSGGSTLARNNILQDNPTDLLGHFVTLYNDAADGFGDVLPGTGDISVPVAFLDAVAGDYRVNSSQPTVDAGDPADAYSLEPAPNGSRINMGAFGNTSLAATSPPPPTPPPTPDPVPGGGGGGGGGCTGSAAPSTAVVWIAFAAAGCALLLARRS